MIHASQIRHITLTFDVEILRFIINEKGTYSSITLGVVSFEILRPHINIKQTLRFTVCWDQFLTAILMISFV